MGLNLLPAVHKLCDFGQVTKPTWALTSSPGKMVITAWFTDTPGLDENKIYVGLSVTISISLLSPLQNFTCPSLMELCSK